MLMKTYSLDQLSHVIGQFIEVGKIPPIDQWLPDQIGEIDILIDTMGRWFHEGGQFKRMELAKLFSSILKYQDGRYSLITPHEQLFIKVEDVPFIFEHLAHDNEEMFFVDSLGLLTKINAAEDWQLREYRNVLVPYVRVRNDLWGRVSRNLFYEMVELALDDCSDALQEQNAQQLLIKVNGLSLPLGNLDIDS